MFDSNQHAKDQELQEQVDNLPRFKTLYRDGEAVAAVTTHESVAGTRFVVNGYKLEPCFKGSSDTYSKEYSYESVRSDKPQEILTAWTEALDAAERDIGAKPKQDYTLWIKECQGIAKKEYDFSDYLGGMFKICYEANVSPEKACEMLLIKF